MSTTISKNAIKRKVINVKFLISMVLSCLAATGVITYGFKFPQLLNNNHIITTGSGVACAMAAMLANIMLGTYSILMMKSSKREKINPAILATSLIGSVPYGFLCFFGYQNLLAIPVNVVLSCIVVLVNAGIGYTAIKGVIASLTAYFGKEKLYRKLPAAEQFWRIVGLVIGIIISFIMYLATCDGLTSLLTSNHLDKLVAMNMGYILAVLSWIPVAALFANANQMVANEMYQKTTHLPKSLKKSSLSDFFMILFCLLSGTAIAQMMSDSFSVEKNIPEFFKNDFIQYAAHHYLLVIALLSSAALNYFSLNKLKDYFSK